MSVVTATNNVGPARHALMLPDCECGLCGPTWARRRGRSRRFTEPVTLVTALQAKDAECRAEMVREHRECLSAMVCATDELIATSEIDDPRRATAGLTVVMFAGELASAIRPGEFDGELCEQLMSACEQTVTAAMATAAGCLLDVVEMLQLLAETVG